MTYDNRSHHTGADCRSGPRGADRRHCPGAPGRRIACRGAKRRALEAAARDRHQHPLDGVAPLLGARGRDPRGRRRGRVADAGLRVARARLGRPAIPVGLPSREQSAVISPAAPECVPQDHTEQVLLDHLRSLEPARVELGTEVVGIENGADGARVELRRRGRRAVPRCPCPLCDRRRRCAQRRAPRARHRNARARRVPGGGFRALSRPALGRGRNASPRHLRHPPPRGPRRTPAGRSRRPLAVRRALGAGRARRSRTSRRSGSPG